MLLFVSLPLRALGKDVVIVDLDGMMSKNISPKFKHDGARVQEERGKSGGRQLPVQGRESIAVCVWYGGPVAASL